MMPKIEVLEDHRQLDAHLSQLIWISHSQFPQPISLKPDRDIVQEVLAGIRALEEIKTTEKGAFAGAARTDDADDIAGFGAQRDAFQHFVVAVFFVETFDNEFIHEGYRK